MPPEAAEEARLWLRHAEEDLAAAGLTIAGPLLLPATSLFHSQQAAEKALKAYLVSREEPFPKTHELPRLVSYCKQLDAGFADLEVPAAQLNPFISRYRYPGAADVPEPAEAEAAHGMAAAVVEFVRARL